MTESYLSFPLKCTLKWIMIRFYLNSRNTLGWQPRSVRCSMTGHGDSTSIGSSVSTGLARVVCIFVIPALPCTEYAPLQEGTLETSLQKKQQVPKASGTSFTQISIFLLQMAPFLSLVICKTVGM